MVGDGQPNGCARPLVGRPARGPIRGLALFGVRRAHGRLASHLCPQCLGPASAFVHPPHCQGRAERNVAQPALADAARQCPQLRLQRHHFQPSHGRGNQSAGRRGPRPFGQPSRHRAIGPSPSRRQPPGAPRRGPRLGREPLGKRHRTLGARAARRGLGHPQRSRRSPRPPRLLHEHRSASRGVGRRRSPGAHQRHPRPSQPPGRRSPRTTILALWQRFRPPDLPDAGRRPWRSSGPPHCQTCAGPPARLPLPGRALAATQRGLPRTRCWRPILPLALARGYRPRRRHHPPAAPGNGHLGRGPLHRHRRPHTIKDPVPGGGSSL